MDTMESLLEEIIDEATGKSRKKWALLLVAMIAGAFLALWLTRRSSSTDTDPAPATPVANTSTESTPAVS